MTLKVINAVEELREPCWGRTPRQPAETIGAECRAMGALSMKVMPVSCGSPGPMAALSSPRYLSTRPSSGRPRTLPIIRAPWTRIPRHLPCLRCRGCLHAAGRRDVPTPEFQDFCRGYPELQDVLCGASRPGHFRGVCTIGASSCSTSCNPTELISAKRMLSRCGIIQQMVHDLDLPVRIVVGRDRAARTGWPGSQLAQPLS